MTKPEYKPLREDSALADVLEAARAAGADVPDLELALIDVSGGGLAPDGEAWAARYVLGDARDEGLLRQAMACALRGCVPVLACRAEI